MLTEERFQKILEYLTEKTTITVQELTERLHTSESTIRRDLAALDSMGKLQKIHGGAMALQKDIFQAANTKDTSFFSRIDKNREEKIKIAKFAANTILHADFVFLDAGSTTSYLIDFLEDCQAVFVTNGIEQARKLTALGLKTYLPGGRLKMETEALVGNETVDSLQKYHFTKGFFGTNGISPIAQYSTPDLSEARVKREALGRCKHAYVLADSSKFDVISSVTFGNLKDAVMITTKLADTTYRDYTEIVEVEAL